MTTGEAPAPPAGSNPATVSGQPGALTSRRPVRPARPLPRHPSEGRRSAVLGRSGALEVSCWRLRRGLAANRRRRNGARRIVGRSARQWTRYWRRQKVGAALRAAPAAARPVGEQETADPARSSGLSPSAAHFWPLRGPTSDSREQVWYPDTPDFRGRALTRPQHVKPLTRLLRCAVALRVTCWRPAAPGLVMAGSTLPATGCPQRSLVERCCQVHWRRGGASGGPWAMRARLIFSLAPEARNDMRTRILPPGSSEGAAPRRRP